MQETGGFCPEQSSVASSPTPFSTPDRNLAIASFVIALLSLLTCGGAGAGSVLGFVFGTVALRRANKEPSEFGGAKLATAGIVLSIAAAFLGLVAAINFPCLVATWRSAHETSAVETVRLISVAQAKYQARKTDDRFTKADGRFGDLAKLAAEGLIDARLAAGEMDGYRFTSTPVNVPAMPPMFDTTAIPESTGKFGTGNVSYYSNETHTIYKAKGAVELKATPENRVPPGGTPISPD